MLKLLTSVIKQLWLSKDTLGQLIYRISLYTQFYLYLSVYKHENINEVVLGSLSAACLLIMLIFALCNCYKWLVFIFIKSKV